MLIMFKSADKNIADSWVGEIERAPNIGEEIIIRGRGVFKVTMIRTGLNTEEKEGIAFMDVTIELMERFK